MRKIDKYSRQVNICRSTLAILSGAIIGLDIAISLWNGKPLMLGIYIGIIGIIACITEP